MFEEIERKKNHSALFTILGVFVLVAAIAGVSVAAYTWTYTSDRANTIGTGNISMTLLESTDVIDITDALPTTDATATAWVSDKKSFDFAVTTSASGAPGTINYTVYAIKQDPTSGYTRLNDNQVKVYLASLSNGNETQVLAPTLISGLSAYSGVSNAVTLISNGSHTHTTTGQTKTTNYRLKMWIDYGVDVSHVRGCVDTSATTKTACNAKLNEKWDESNLPGVTGKCYKENEAKSSSVCTGTWQDSKLEYKLKIGVSGSLTA